MAIHLYQNDLPDGLDLGPVVAIDTETMGLDPRRDRLCLVQMSSGDGDAHLVQIAPGQTEAPNLTRMLADPGVVKLFHYGRFDIAALYHAFGALAARARVPWPDVLTALVAAYCKRFVEGPEIVAGVPHMGRFGSAAAQRINTRNVATTYVG